MAHKTLTFVFHSGQQVGSVVASHHGAKAAAARKTGKPMNELVVLPFDQIGPDDMERALFCAALESATLDPNFWVPA